MRWWPDIVVALGLAVVCGLIIDYLRIGSRLRQSVEEWRNRRAERSAGRLRKRIRKVEQYRDRLVRASSSDTGLYLAVLGSILIVLVLMCFGAVILVLQRAGVIRNDLVLPLGVFIFAGLFGLMGYNMAVGVWIPDYSRLIKKTNASIQRLKVKLAEKTSSRIATIT